MKSTITTLPPPPPVFTPFELVIRVETVEEAKALATYIGLNGKVNFQPLIDAYKNPLVVGDRASGPRYYDNVTAEQVAAAVRNAFWPVWNLVGKPGSGF